MPTMTENDIEGFLKLPDWRKFELRKGTKYTNYPLMTKDQEVSRTIKIFSIACHFGNTTYESLEENPFLSMEGMWPASYEWFITPKLLDIFDINYILKLSYCLYCRYWAGYRKEFLKNFAINKIRILPISGYCLKAITVHGRNRNSMVSPHSKCPKWEPATFYKQIILNHILTEIEKKGYTHQEFFKDKEEVDFWEYFFTSTSK